MKSNKFRVYRSGVFALMYWYLLSTTWTLLEAIKPLKCLPRRIYMLLWTFSPWMHMQSIAKTCEIKSAQGFYLHNTIRKLCEARQGCRNRHQRLLNLRRIALPTLQKGLGLLLIICWWILKVWDTHQHFSGVNDTGIESAPHDVPC